MTRETEERIVAMYFDNEDFEKNAKTTIETLGQLKSGLDLKDSAKGFEVFDKLGKTLNFEKAQKGLGKIKSTLTGMTGIFKKVFNLGPIDEAAAAVENFKTRYLDRVLGFDLARVVANSLESAFRGLTIQPVTAGWTQYQNKMDSVKTIMSSTGESIETVENHLQSLTEYANKTIYSLSDMTSNLGKFTNNGMKLKDSVLAMQGIANAAADAGQGAQQASMAMYNFSQAMGVGKMTTIDWKSIENANMATQRLKNTFIEMAAAQGELHKEFSETDKKYHYYITKNSKGQAEKDRKKWTEVTAKNFRETLSKDWLTAEAMMHALMVYSGEALDPDTIKSWGITDPKMIKDLEKIGKEALNAATQVRTFSKMMDASKEAAQSGWADSFELIFGNMEQGTTLWTNLNDVLDEVLTKSAETRNNMLQIWAGSSESTKEEETELTSKTESLEALKAHLEQLKKDGDIELTNNEINELTASIQKYRDQINELKKGKTKDNSESTQAQIDRRLDKIKELEKKVTELKDRNKKNASAQKNRDRITELEEQINAYQAEILTLTHANEIDSDYNADASAKRQKQITEKEQKMAKLQKELDKLRESTGVDEIAKTEKEIADLEKEIEQLGVVIDEKNAKEKSVLLDEQGRTGREILFDKDTGALFQLIGLAREFGTTVSEAFGNAFGVMDAEKLFNMTKDFGNAVKTVVGWFGKANEEGSRMSKIKKGLQGIFAILKTVLNFVKIGWNLIKKIITPVSDFFLNIFEKFGDFFGNLGELKPVEVFQKLGEGLQKTWEKVKKFFTPQEIIDASGKGTGVKELPVITWMKEVWEGLKGTVRQWAEENGLGEVYTNVSNWWHEFTDSVDKAFGEVKTWWEGTGIPKFFEDMWNSITGLFQRQKIGVDDRGFDIYADSPITQFFKNIKTSVSTAFESVKTWWNESGIPDFFTSMWNGIVGLFKRQKTGVDDRGFDTYADSPIVEFFKGIKKSVGKAFSDVETWWNDSDISGFFTKMWNGITGLFQRQKIGVDDRGFDVYADSPIAEFFKGIKKSVGGAFDNVKEWWDGSGIPEFFTKMWNGIVGLFERQKTGVDDRGFDTYEDSPIVKFFNGIRTGIETAFQNLSNWWYNESGIPKFFEDMWNKVSGWFSPKLDFVTYDSTGRHEHYADAPIVSWLKSVWDDVKRIWDAIGKWEGWKEIGDFLSNTWKWIVDLFAGSSDSVASTTGSLVDASKQSNLTPEETEKGLNFFQRIMTTIGDFISKVFESINGIIIPTEVSTFFTNLLSFLEGIMMKIGDVFGSFGKWFKNGWGSEGWTSEDTWNIILTIFGLIGTVVMNLVTSKWTSKLSAVNNIGSQFLMFAGGVMLIASAVAMLTAVDPNRLGAAFGVVEVIAITIGGFITKIAKLTSTQNAITSTPVERFFTNLINKVASVATIAIILKELPTIIKEITAAKKSGVENLGDDLLKIAETVALLFSSITLTMAIVNKLGGGAGIDPKATALTLASFLEVFVVISAVVMAVGGTGELAKKLFGDNAHDTVIKALNNAAEFFQGLGNAIGGFFAGLFGIKSDKAKTMEALDIADMLTEASKAFDSEKISGLSRMMSLITSLSTDTSKINTGKMSEFAVAMGNLGDGIYTIASYVSEVEGPLAEMHNSDSIQYKKLEGVIGFVSKIGSAFSSFAPFMDTTSWKMHGFTSIVNELTELAKDENLDKLTQSLSKMMTKFSTDLPNGDLIEFDGLSIVEKLFKAIQVGLDSGENLPAFDATSIVDAITLALTAGDEAIAQIVHDMVQNGLELSSKKDPFKLPEGSVTIDPGGTVNPFGSSTGIESLVDLGDLELGSLNGSVEEYQSLFSGLGDTFSQFNANIPDLGSTLDSNGWSSFLSIGTEEGAEDTILTELQSQMTSLSEAMKEVPDKFEITITPVFDMTNMTPEKLQAAFDNQFSKNPLLARVTVDSPTSKVDFSTLHADLGIDRLDLKLASILLALNAADRNNFAAIEDLRQNMNGISSAIASMRLVLDTGVLVGQITPMVDYELGRRASLFGRTGVLFGAPK